MSPYYDDFGDDHAPAWVRWKDAVFVVAIALLLVGALIGFLVLPGARAIERDRKACEARGGVQAKAYSGFVCVKRAATGTVRRKEDT